MKAKDKEIVLESLHDYKKWFEDNPEKQQEIDSAILSLNPGSYSGLENKREFFPVTSLAKEDIIQAFDGDSKIKRIVMKLEDNDMKYLASKMADDYCNQLFWDSLRIIFETAFLNCEEEKDNVE